MKTEYCTRIWDTKHQKWASGGNSSRTIWFGKNRHVQTLRNLQRFDATPGRYVVKLFELTYREDI